MLTKALGKRHKGKHYSLKYTPYLCSVGFNKCVHMSVFKVTYAPRGFPGSGRSSAECEALWTRLTWHYLAPEMQETGKHTLVSHTLNFTVTHASVSDRSQ